MLARGRHHMSIPGPSAMPERVIRAMMRDAPNIYEGELVDMTPGIFAGLRRVAATEAGEAVIYIGNGHATWEAALANTLSRGDRVLVPVSGRFGHGWADYARRMGLEVEVLDGGPRAPVDPGQIEAALRARPAAAVLAVQVDTSSSVRSDIAGIRAALDAAGSDALLMVDSIACLACEPMEMDAWGVDVLCAASQKGLMTPPGLALCWASPKAQARRGDLVTPYWDWRPRISREVFYMAFGGTAPTHHLFALSEALAMLDEEGLPAVFARHRVLAGAVRAAVAAWGLEFNVTAPEARSDSVTTIRTRPGDGLRLRRWAEAHGLTLGIGLALEGHAGHTESLFRIGHMGHLSPPMVLGCLATIEAGLTALGIPHAPGTAAAAAAIAEAEARAHAAE